jgi:hypothetical protein
MLLKCGPVTNNTNMVCTYARYKVAVPHALTLTQCGLCIRTVCYLQFNDCWRLYLERLCYWNIITIVRC